jgi:uncharacterized membrane protein YdjX (TVP38/TMEM64 family)
MTRRALIFVAFVCVLVALSLVLRRFVSLDVLIEEETRLRESLARHPWIGLGIGFLAYLVASLIPGLAGKAMVVGWFYGFWQALIVVNIGLTIAALVTFSASRYFFHDFVASRYGRRLARVNDALEREGVTYLFAARVLHTPFSLTNYVMGVTRIRPRSFWWATQLGILPGNILFVYAGCQVPTLEELAEQGYLSLLSPGLIVAFVALSVLPLLLRPLMRRLEAFAERRHAG